MLPTYIYMAVVVLGLDGFQISYKEYHVWGVSRVCYLEMLEWCSKSGLQFLEVVPLLLHSVLVELCCSNAGSYIVLMAVSKGREVTNCVTSGHAWSR